MQSPRPPIILGGAAKRRGAALAAKYADEFNAGFGTVDDTRAIFERIRDAAEETGRELVLSIAHTTVVGKDEAELERRARAIGRDVGRLREGSIAGTPAEVVDRLGAFAELGATRAYLQILDLADVEHLELIAAEVMPHV